MKFRNARSFFAGAGILFAAVVALAESTIPIEAVQASSIFQGYVAEQAIDGVISDNSRWLSEKIGNAPEWLELQLAQPTAIGGVVIYSGYQDGQAVRKVSVEYRKNGRWEPVAETSGNQLQELRLQFDSGAVETDALRILFHDRRDHARIREVQLLPASVSNKPAIITVHPDQPKQTIWGIGFEIQSDSIGSGNNGLPEEPLGVPHDLVPSERDRFADEMLSGFRYCRLAGGLYWRGLDAEQKRLQPRWPEQLEELRALLDRAGVEGVSLEYWSPAPFWKSTRSYIRGTLRCFGEDFANDPDYHGDIDRFLSDFGAATADDVRTLKAAGIKTSMWGLQNEPHVGGAKYSSCGYHSADDYNRAYQAVAAALRAVDPSIVLFGDTSVEFPKLIAERINEPDFAALVDAYVIHTIGRDSATIPRIHERIRKELPLKPWFQNEYEYLTGGATPARCLNTAQHIMDSFQIGENPTWFWLHALKPFKNSEASGYSLGFWKSRIAPETNTDFEQLKRWVGGPQLTDLPDVLQGAEFVCAQWPKRATKPGPAFMIVTDAPAEAFMLVDEESGFKPSEEWTLTDLKVTRADGKTDRIYRTELSNPGRQKVPGNPSGAPHALFLKPVSGNLDVDVGVNSPCRIQSKAVDIERKGAALELGHWMFNDYNWNAVGSFAKRIPWDSVVVEVDEPNYDADARILAFRRPNGKLTLVLSNRHDGSKTFEINTGLPETTQWKRFRYTPTERGENTMGIELPALSGSVLKPELETMSWEFFEEL